MGGAITSVPLAPFCFARGELYLFFYIFINNIQNPHTAVRPIDTRMIKE
jgi:hypothetical protein